MSDLLREWRCVLCAYFILHCPSFPLSSLVCAPLYYILCLQLCVSQAQASAPAEVKPLLTNPEVSTTEYNPLNMTVLVTGPHPLTHDHTD